MDTRIDACVLWARAAAVGVLAFGLGVVGHVTADGRLPGPALLAVLLTVAVVASAPLLQQRASALRLVAMLVGGQAAIHVFLTVTAGHVGDPTRATHVRSGELGTLPVVDGRRAGSLLDAYDAGGGASHDMAPALPVGHLLDDLTAHAPMMAVHLAAAALVGLWLAYGEHSLWSLLALTGRRIHLAVLLLLPVTLPAARLVSTADRSPHRPRSLWFVHPHARRGPPLLLAV